jgi:hypothetical protein
MNSGAAEGLENILKQNLEADITAELELRLNVSSLEALRLYYSSKAAKLVSAGLYGTQYLSAGYLAQEVIKELGLTETAPRK